MNLSTQQQKEGEQESVKSDSKFDNGAISNSSPGSFFYEVRPQRPQIPLSYFYFLLFYFH
jgi:hypothetical protein